MTRSGHLRNLALASAAVTAVLFAGFDLIQWVQAYASDQFHNDFTFYFAAARIGLTRGWPSLYNLAIQQQQLDALHSRITIAQLARYISPPPLAWLVIPFTALPYDVAYWAWSGLLLAALIATWHLAAPGGGRMRVVLLAAAVGWLPVIYGLQLGQPGFLVAFAVAACYALLLRRHDFWAGVALAPLALKPQLAFLVPPALLFAGRWRSFAGAAASLGALGAVSAIALGGSGLSDYLARLGFAATVPVNRELTLAFLLGAAARPVEIAIAVWTVAIAYRLRTRPVEWVLACALVGGLLATPYVHLDDVMMLGLAAWLALRASAPAWAVAFVIAGVVAVEGTTFWGPAPILLFEVAGLALLTVVAIRAPADETARLETPAATGSPQPLS